MTIMFIIAKILLILLCILLFVFMSILFIPFKYYFAGKMDNNIGGKAEVHWLFGLFKITICKDKNESELKINILGLNILKKMFLKKAEIKKEKNSNKRFKINNIGKELLLDLFNYVKDIVNYIKPKELKIVGVYGFEDPSLTGMLLGLISAIRDIVPDAKIDLEPVFDEKTINIEGQINGVVKVNIICYRTIKMLIKKEIRQILFKKTKTAETS